MMTVTGRLRRCCALGLAAALACVDAEHEQKGEHVTLIIDPALQPCGDPLGHMDRFVATLADYLGVALVDQRFTYYWYSQERFAAEVGCGSMGVRCGDDTTILSSAVPLDFELARVVLGLVGWPPRFYELGATVVFASETDGVFAGGYGVPGDFDVQAQIALDVAEPRLAGSFTRFLIDHYGLEAYLAFYASLGPTDPLPVIEAAHAAQFGESLTETVLRFADERRACRAPQFRFKLFECGAPPITWDGDSLLLRRSLACGEEGVVGPFTDEKARTFSTLEVETAGYFEVTLASDEPAGAMLGGCGGCEDESLTKVLPGGEPVRRWLPAGRYYLNFYGRVEAATSVALRIERVDAP